MYSLKLDAFDGQKISLNIWDDVKEKVGVVCISHGMAEYAERYDDFARFLNCNGFVVLADDHRGHRNNTFGVKGRVAGDSFAGTVEDVKSVVDYAKNIYSLPVILLGHSYGSFIAQRFLEKYSSLVTKCILSGTAYIKSPLMGVGCVIATVQNILFGGTKTGKLIDKLSFGEYNKPFASEGHKFSWLSRDPAVVEKYEKDEYCGYPLSIGFYRSFFAGAMRLYGVGTRNIRKEIPILVTCGSEDPVSEKSKQAVKLYDYYKKAGLNVSIKVYEGARHEILNEVNRAEVYNDFLAFIKG